ncbi:MAG: phosphoenolpyruvate carboxykinase [Tissierellia bacterium]|nr:phosphoenolpyruvate carboxykinase [Tissierellia bacterium]
MNKEWSLFNDKAIINFSKVYPDTFEKVLESEGFRSVLESFLMRSQVTQDRNYGLVKKYTHSDILSGRIDALVKIGKMLTIMNSRELKDTFPQYGFVFDHQGKFRALAEDLYTYWRNLERYCILFDGSPEGLGSSSFIDAKTQFDQLILNLYRKVSNNISMNKPKVYRQVPAGTNVGLILKDLVWPIPEEYHQLKWIPFIKEAVIESPFITYPKRNTRDGFFEKLDKNPISRASLNNNHFIALPIWVGDLLCYVFCHRNFMTHLISLTNLFEIATEVEAAGRKPDLLLLFGVNDKAGAFDGFYIDEKNDLILGYISNDDRYDYFGYMKKMILTLHNTMQMERGNLPIHGAMVQIKTRDGSSANVVIMGDSGAGKSESIEAFRVLADDYISDLLVIFDDMGIFRRSNTGEKIKGYGTEIGAFVRLDDLDAGYAFKQLDRSIFMNPDRINARLITPITPYEDIIEGYPVDLFLYANNFDELGDGSAIEFFDNKEQAIELFRSGKRMAKGTTTESGLTTSYFANPFGPYQNQELCDELIDRFFEDMFKQDVKVGQIKTQLGIKGKEKTGPEQAALDLFEVMKNLNMKAGQKKSSL